MSSPTTEQSATVNELLNGHSLSREEACQLHPLSRRRTPSSPGSRPRSQATLQAGRHYLFAQSLPPVDQSLPRLLRLLHFPPRSRRTRRAHHDPGRGSGSRAARAKSWAAPRLCSAWATSLNSLFPEMRDTLRHLGYNSTLHYLEAMCELVLRETTPAAASQSRPAERRMDRAPGCRFSQHGSDA